jgi:hypothetical protein
MGFPLRIVCGGFIDVADGDTLNVWFLQEVKHDAKTLGADADESDIYLVARRNIAGAAQYVPRNNGKAKRRRGCLSEKPAT